MKRYLLAWPVAPGMLSAGHYAGPEHALLPQEGDGCCHFLWGSPRVYLQHPQGFGRQPLGDVAPVHTALAGRPVVAQARDIVQVTAEDPGPQGPQPLPLVDQT